MILRKNTLFRTEEVKREMLSFLDSNFFTPIFFVGIRMYSEKEIVTLRKIQKQLREDRSRLVDESAVMMLQDLDVCLPQWGSFDTDLEAFGLPTTHSLVRKMILMGRFSERPIQAFRYTFDFLTTKKSG